MVEGWMYYIHVWIFFFNKMIIMIVCCAFVNTKCMHWNWKFETWSNVKASKHCNLLYETLNLLSSMKTNTKVKHFRPPDSKIKNKSNSCSWTFHWILIQKLKFKYAPDLLWNRQKYSEYVEFIDYYYWQSEKELTTYSKICSKSKWNKKTL